jgi:hypothetical protein
MHQLSFPVWFVTVYIAMWLAMAVHEVGHVIGAFLTRQRIWEVHFGYYNPKWHVRLRRIMVWWSLIPYGGYTLASPVSPKNHLVRQFIYVAAGLVASGLTCAAAWWFRDDLVAWSGGNAVLDAGLGLLATFAGIVTLGSLFGWEGSSADGAALVRILSSKAEANPSEHLREFYFREAKYHLSQRHMRRAARLLRRAMRLTDLTRTPEYREYFAAVFAAAGLYHTESMRLLQEAGEALPPEADPARWIGTLDGAATEALRDGRRELFPEYRVLIDRAIARAPEKVTLKGTLGSLLFELGEFDAATALLHEVYLSSTAALDRGITSAYLAALAHQGGRQTEACEYVLAAVEHAGEDRLVKRVLNEAGLAVAGLASQAR